MSTKLGVQRIPGRIGTAVQLAAHHLDAMTDASHLAMLVRHEKPDRVCLRNWVMSESVALRDLSRRLHALTGSVSATPEATHELKVVSAHRYALADAFRRDTDEGKVAGYTEACSDLAEMRGSFSVTAERLAATE
jgi:hypothetical protein